MTELVPLLLPLLTLGGLAGLLAWSRPWHVPPVPVRPGSLLGQRDEQLHRLLTDFSARRETIVSASAAVSRMVAAAGVEFKRVSSLLAEFSRRLRTCPLCQEETLIWNGEGGWFCRSCKARSR